MAALIGFPSTFIIGDVRVLYRLFMWGAWAGVWITGVRVELSASTAGSLPHLYLHDEPRSNIDPPFTSR